MSDRARAFKAMSRALRRSTQSRNAASNRFKREAGSPGLEEFARAYRELAAVSATLQDRLGAEDPLSREVQDALEHAREAWKTLLVGGFQGEASPVTDGLRVTDSPQSRAELRSQQASPGGDLDDRPQDRGFVETTEGEPAEPSAEDTATHLNMPVVGTPTNLATDSASADAPHRFSVELVPAASSALTAAPGRSRYPDEAALVRYFRRRRERHRLPDEAAIARYLRERRERGPRYPDEAAIARYLRERRETR